MVEVFSRTTQPFEPVSTTLSHSPDEHLSESVRLLFDRLLSSDLLSSFLKSATKVRINVQKSKYNLNFFGQ